MENLCVLLPCRLAFATASAGGLHEPFYAHDRLIVGTAPREHESQCDEGEIRRSRTNDPEALEERLGGCRGWSMREQLRDELGARRNTVE